MSVLPWLSLIFPTWKLFAERQAFYQLQYCTKSSDEEFSEWMIAVRPPARQTLPNLFFNPEGNLYLAEMSLVRRFLGETLDQTNFDSHQAPIETASLSQNRLFIELVAIIHRVERLQNHNPGGFRARIIKVDFPDGTVESDLVFLTPELSFADFFENAAPLDRSEQESASRDDSGGQ